MIYIQKHDKQVWEIKKVTWGERNEGNKRKMMEIIEKERESGKETSSETTGSDMNCGISTDSKLAHNGTYYLQKIFVISVEKWVRESSGRESVNRSWSDSLRWPVGGARLWGIGAEGPEHRSFLLRMSVRKGHAVFVWAAAYFLSQSLSLPFSPSSSISYYIFMFSICPTSWNNVFSFQKEAAKRQKGK